MDHFYRPEDQSKIRLAIGLRRVDAEDVPETAKHRQVAPTSTGPSQRKRKLEYEASFGSEGSPPSSSQPGSSQPLSRTSGPSSSQITQPVEDIEDEDSEEEIRDELYVVLRTSIVGVQYYKGTPNPSIRTPFR